MSISKVTFFLFIFAHTLLAYEDSDIDGVDDAIDLCPNTSFDKLVDEDGCPQSEPYWGTLTFQIGYTMSFDELNNRSSDYNFFSSYQYKQWNISLSNANQTSYDNNNNASSNTGDVYLSTAYLFDNDDFQTKVTLGTKIATADDEVGTGENDYFTALSLTYLLNERQNIFTHFNYSLNGDSPEINYENSFAYALGTGYMLNPNCYASLSYEYVSSIYTEGENYEALSLFLSHIFLENYFISLNYTHGLDDLSYKHTLGFNIGMEL